VIIVGFDTSSLYLILPSTDSSSSSSTTTTPEKRISKDAYNGFCQFVSDKTYKHKECEGGMPKRLKSISQCVRTLMSSFLNYIR